MPRTCFTDMWNLILENHATADFSAELLIGLFWEETQFQNIKQNHGPAVGFGQVEPPTIKAVNRFFNCNFSTTLILIDDPTSVQITSWVLYMLRYKGLSPRACLRGYAGSSPARTSDKVAQWLRCESILRSGGTDDMDNVRAALTAAEPNHATAINDVLN
jgi:hypothetical protein